MSDRLGVVLVIEDNPYSLELAAEVLEGADYFVLRAGSAEAGLAIARETKADLILMDIELPGIDGQGALAQLRTDPRTRAIPVVALTACAMLGDEERLLAAGFDGYLAKPIRTASFASQVGGFLAKRGGQR